MSAHTADYDAEPWRASLPNVPRCPALSAPGPRPCPASPSCDPVCPIPPVVGES